MGPREVSRVFDAQIRGSELFEFEAESDIVLCTDVRDREASCLCRALFVCLGGITRTVVRSQTILRFYAG